MDILFQLSSLLFEDAESLDDKSSEYRNLKDIEGRLFNQLPGELREKLMDIQTEIEYQVLLTCFLYGLRVGFAASKLGQSG